MAKTVSRWGLLREALATLRHPPPSRGKRKLGPPVAPLLPEAPSYTDDAVGEAATATFAGPRPLAPAFSYDGTGRLSGAPNPNNKETLPGTGGGHAGA
jgi:hypothetical protein